MYRRENRHQLSLADFFLPFGGKLSGDNRWIKLAELIAWNELEDCCAAQFCKGIGQGKRRFGMGLIREKLALTQGSTIAMNILVMNIEKLLELLFVLFTCWLHLLWARGSVNNAHSDLFLAHGVMA